MLVEVKGVPTAASILRCTISLAFVMIRVLTAFLFKRMRAMMAAVAINPIRAAPMATSTSVIPASARGLGAVSLCQRRLSVGVS